MRYTTACSGITNQSAISKMKLDFCPIILLAAVSPLLTFSPQFTPNASAQSVTAKSCVADVIGDDIGSLVNIRSGPGVEYKVIGAVTVGNLVIVANDDQSNTVSTTVPMTRRDKEGYLWFNTSRFRQSPYRGWMRSDFLRLKCPQ